MSLLTSILSLLSLLPLSRLPLHPDLHSFPTRRSSDLTFPILASLLVRLVVLLPFQLLRLSLATPSRWTPLALSVSKESPAIDRKSGSAGMPRPISYAVFCLKKKKKQVIQYDDSNSTTN